MTRSLMIVGTASHVGKTTKPELMDQQDQFKVDQVDVLHFVAWGAV